MPFEKVGKNDYTSPSGRHFNTAQVRLWYAKGGKFPGQKKSELSAAHQTKVETKVPPPLSDDRPITPVDRQKFVS